MRTIVAIMAGLLHATSSAAELRVVGTDLLGLEFTKALYAFAGQNGLKLALALEGTRPGLEQLTAGRADFGVLVSPADAPPLPAGFDAQPIGYHAVIVVVPVSCPIERITFGQLAAVFGAGGGTAGPASVRWGDLGAGGDWNAELVSPLLPEVGTGIALEYFRHVVLRNGAWKRDVPRYASSAEFAAQFGPASRVLAVTAALPAGATTMKPLKLATTAEQPGVLATPETLYAGSYPLRLPVQFVFRAERRAGAGRLAGFFHGDVAARLLAEAGVTPLPAAQRAEQRRILQAKEKPSN